MYCIRKVTDDLLWIGGNDRQSPLFESAHPVPRGMSYNAYLLLDEKTVLFDTVDRAVQTQFFENLEHALGGRRLDYVFVHHMEPDHAATLGDLMIRHPEATIVCNGNSFADLEQAFKMFDLSHGSGKPTCFLLRTTKGLGGSYMENAVDWHGKAPNDEEYAQAMTELRAAHATLEKEIKFNNG